MKKLFFLGAVLLLAGLNLNAQQWVQVWGDEFNTPGLPDKTKWDYEIGKLRNNELQYYTDRQENARIQDSILIIELRKENYQGAAYTSASLVSRYKGDWQYGKFEISAKVPAGTGTWPAIWMMPTDNMYGTWPKSGEIDIMEYVGMNPSNLYFTVHYEGTDGSGHQSSGYSIFSSKPYDRFIKFTLEWSPTDIKWYADDKLYFTYTKKADDQRIWPFNKMFYLILNFAYGGSWGGQRGVDDTKLPNQFLIDYVRVYQLQDSEGPFSLEVVKTAGGNVSVSPEQTTYDEGSTVTLTAVPDPGYEFDKWMHIGSMNPLQLEMNKNWSVTPAFFKKDELISNGDFSKGLSGWGSWSEASVAPAFTTTASDSVFVANITKPGTANWHIVEQQLNVPLVKGVTYNVSFDAWADTPKPMDVFFSKNWGDYGNYYSTVKNVTSIRQRFTWSVKMNYSTDLNCRFGFGIGQFTGKLYIDNVSVEKSASTTSATINSDPDNTFTVFPNPASTLLQISGQNTGTSPVRISLYNLQGQLVSVLKNACNFEKEESVQIDLKSLNIPKGVYLIEFMSEQKQLTKKIAIN